MKQIILHKYIAHLLIAFIVYSGVTEKACGQTYVSGSITNNTTWTPTGSPYIIQGTVTITCPLFTIQPGVNVQFEDDAGLSVPTGNFIAEGTQADSIIFTSNSPTPHAGSWSGIVFDDDREVLRYCSFSYANTAVAAQHTYLNIYNSTFNNNGVGVSGAGVRFTAIFNSTFDSNTAIGIDYITRADTVYNCIVTNNNTGIKMEVISQYEYPHTYISQCRIESNQLGIDVSGVPEITNCDINYNGTGIGNWNLGSGPEVITGNNITGNDEGIIVYQAGNHQIYCNNIYDNTYLNVDNWDVADLNLEDNYWGTNDTSAIYYFFYSCRDDATTGCINILPLLRGNCSPLVDFETDGKTNYCGVPKCENINNESTFDADSWFWEIGSSGTDTLTVDAPATIWDCFNTAGKYDVSLTGTKGNTVLTKFKKGFINAVNSPPVHIWLSHDTLYATTDSAFVSYLWQDSIYNIKIGPRGNYLVIDQPDQYYVTVTNSNGCTAFGFINVQLSDMIHNTVAGRCFIDYNANSVIDPGEPPYPFVMVKSYGDTNSVSTQVDQQGLFTNTIYEIDSVYTTLQSTPPAYTFSPALHASDFTTYNLVDSVNFALVPIPGIRDIQITMLSNGFEVIGNDEIYHIKYINAGSDTISSGTVYFVKDSRLLFVSSNPNYSTINGDSIAWTYSNFLPGEARTIDITIHLPTSLHAGDRIISEAILEPLTPNYNLTNNHAWINDIVQAAWDPNGKKSLFGDEITLSQIADQQYLTYLILFQNTGNAQAYNITIQDSIDTNLNISSFNIISSSYPCSTTILDDKIVKFKFNNIYLPDSTANEAASHGYVCYRIKANTNTVSGTQIKNTANIYFDYNPNVNTNTSIVQVPMPLAVIPLNSENSNLLLYPNPVKDKLHFDFNQLPEKYNLKLMDIFGRELLIIHSKSSKDAYIDVSMFAAGIYFLKIEIEDGTRIGKFVKE